MPGPRIYISVLFTLYHCKFLSYNNSESQPRIFYFDFVFMGICKRGMHPPQNRGSARCLGVVLAGSTAAAADFFVCCSLNHGDHPSLTPNSMAWASAQPQSLLSRDRCRSSRHGAAHSSGVVVESCLHAD